MSPGGSPGRRPSRNCCRACANALGTSCRRGDKPKRTETPPRVLTRERLRGRMDLYRTAESPTFLPGTIAPADGNLASGVASGFSPASCEAGEDSALKGRATTPPADFGPNYERLEDVQPKLVHAFRG